MSVNSSQTFVTCTGFKEYMVFTSASIFSRTILILPLVTFILHQAYRRWWPHRSFQGCTHSDVLTYNVVFLELIGAMDLVLFIPGMFSPHLVTVMVFFSFFSYTVFCGQTGFHILACFERYVAVVHPLVYRKFKNARGIWIRNVLVSGVWVLSLLLSGLCNLSSPRISIVTILVILVTSIVLVSIPSISILCVLIHPGPGKGKAAIDQSRDNALFTILAILAIQWFSLFGFLVLLVVKHMELLELRLNCVLMALSYWCSIPSSLVQPLLYLRKTRAMPCCQLKSTILQVIKRYDVKSET